MKNHQLSPHELNIYLQDLVTNLSIIAEHLVKEKSRTRRNNDPNLDLVYDVYQMAKIFNVSVRTIQRWIAIGEIYAFKIKGKSYSPKAYIEAKCRLKKRLL